MVETNIPQTVELVYPQIIASFFDGYHSAHAFQQKSSIQLGLHPRIVACKIKILSVKYIYIKTTN
jgi:hypothetical protein